MTTCRIVDGGDPAVDAPGDDLVVVRRQPVGLWRHDGDVDDRSLVGVPQAGVGDRITTILLATRLSTSPTGALGLAIVRLVGAFCAALLLRARAVEGPFELSDLGRQGGECRLRLDDVRFLSPGPGCQLHRHLDQRSQHLGDLRRQTGVLQQAGQLPDKGLDPADEIGGIGRRAHSSASTAIIAAITARRSDRGSAAYRRPQLSALRLTIWRWVKFAPGQGRPVHPVGLEVEPHLLGDDAGLVVHLKRERAPPGQMLVVETARVPGDHYLARPVTSQVSRQRHMRQHPSKSYRYRRVRLAGSPAHTADRNTPAHGPGRESPRGNAARTRGAVPQGSRSESSRSTACSNRCRCCAAPAACAA